MLVEVQPHLCDGVRCIIQPAQDEGRPEIAHHVTGEDEDADEDKEEEEKEEEEDEQDNG